MMGPTLSDDSQASTPYEPMSEDEPGSAAAGPSLSSTTHIRDFALQKAPATKITTSAKSSADLENDVLLIVITDRAYGS